MPSEYNIGVFKFAVADPNELALYGGAILGAFLLLAVVFYFRVGTRPKRKCDCCGENCGCGDNCSCGKTSDSKEISNAATSSAEVSTEKRCEACGADCTCGTTCDCGKESKRAAKKAEQPVKSPVKATKTKPVEGSFLSPDGRRSGRLHSKKEK